MKLMNVCLFKRKQQGYNRLIQDMKLGNVSLELSSVNLSQYFLNNLSVNRQLSKGRQKP